MPTAIRNNADDGLDRIRRTVNKAWANSPDEGYRWVRLAVTQTCHAGLEALGVRRYNGVSLMWKVRSLLRHGGTA